ncbi:HlyD family secretion protein [Tolypothrix sp. NIES-4075]|uniref:HlyD family efflux transporter periplasmic adaptor subunit n=1 Tax=Tolypothrix sp. NIES-4075 TaxID=2005459 RepID=UPI000B5C39EA|nr:HlyD family efflux transporter periplasmic adaptor subunit [Tolypothrix sp. NIES-4075]GAX41862.1 HlyD family secretion protein [Tolypothrix sp. NIES-4075]
MNFEFDQPVILQRSPILSRAVLWGIVGVTSFTLIWSAVAKIDEAIPATGKLEPQATVREVKVPLNGLVKEVYVKDGQQVKQGDLLLRLDHTAQKAQKVYFQKVRNTLLQENQFYQSQMSDKVRVPAANQVKLPEEMAMLTKNRASLVAENQLYRVQLSGKLQGVNLTPDQQLRLQTNQQELKTKAATVKLEASQLEKQVVQNQVKLANTKNVLRINQGILKDLEPLFKQGAIARLQYLQQEQQVSTQQSEVDGFIQEGERLKLAIAQSGQRLQNTMSASTQDLWTKIADNDKRIAEIDSQLKKAIVENEKNIAELDSQISQNQVSLDYQEIRSPVNGTIFDLKASNPGFVANSTEPVLKVVPENSLKAEVFLTNKDIGFVRAGMPVDIRIDSFPFSEFGDIKGTLESIGSDALPPTQIRNYYSFPVTVRLNQQALTVKDKQLPLQSGMAVSVNIKLRKRTILSIFIDGFTQQIESLKFMR